MTRRASSGNDSGPAEGPPTELVRALGLWALIAYGVGDILGAGIYALIGKVAGEAGHAAWLSFGLAMGVAAFTALSYSELVVRLPHSGGESRFCERGFRRGWIGLLVGWLVFCSGLVSLATISRAFAGYLHGAGGAIPDWTIVVALLLLLGAINYRGIEESSAANILCTLVEAGGLLFVLVAGLAHLQGGDLPGAGLADAAGAVESGIAAAVPAEPGAGDGSGSWLSIARGAALSFFAFIGFQDMVNVAEEVEEPERRFPIAILTALVVTGCVYMLVVFVATEVVPPAQLAEGEAPLLQVVERAAPWVPPWSFTIVALFAVANTGLLNFIMASRLLFGMSRQGMLPAWLGRVHARRRTPHRAIGVVTVAAAGFALSGTLTYLAGTTSVLLLSVFAAVNGALLAMKLREWRAGERAPSGFRVPWPVPAMGVVVSLALLGFVEASSLGAAAVLLALGGLVVGLQRIRGQGASAPSLEAREP